MNNEHYGKIARLLDFLYEADTGRKTYGDLLPDSEITRLRNNFLKRYSPDKLEKLSGYDLLSHFYDIGSDSLLHCISLDTVCKANMRDTIISCSNINHMRINGYESTPSKI